MNAAKFRRCAAALVLWLFAGAAPAATFEWVNGKVGSITSYLMPEHTIAVVNGQIIRFCDPVSGMDYAVKTSNIQYDLLKAALMNNRHVKVGVQNFGKSPLSDDEFLSAESVRLCIDRIIVTN